MKRMRARCIAFLWFERKLTIQRFFIIYPTIFYYLSNDFLPAVQSFFMGRIVRKKRQGS